MTGIVLECLALLLSVGGIGTSEQAKVALPPPSQRGETSVEEALSQRRSIREYGSGPLDLSELGQLLWAAQGITGAGQRRAAPSAGALYPLEAYAVVGEVRGIAPGVYRYVPSDHSLRMHAEGDKREPLAAAALDQDCVREAPVVLVLAGAYERTTRKYESRGVRYVQMEVGHAAENVYLQAGAIGLGTVLVGAFDDERVAEVLGLDPSASPLALLPVGRRAASDLPEADE